jgi:hypothetical protein
VKADDEPELDAREDDRVKFHAHFHSDGLVVRGPASLDDAWADVLGHRRRPVWCRSPFLQANVLPLISMAQIVP